jgi:mannose-1-phosphate guanylyltransferase
MNKHDYCVIMAGGVGSRFWPVSRSSKPKQFLDMLGVGKSLLQQTYERFQALIPRENILIVSNAEYAEMIKEQLPLILDENVLLEPYRRNTAPCIAYAAYKIYKKDPDAKMVVAPSDHLILKESLFIELIKESLEFVADNKALLTLGIPPSRPETGYGYIQMAKNMKIDSHKNAFHSVKTFTEKPNIEMARIFFESGEFFWNAGIFVWSLKTILKSFEKYLPEINNSFAEGIELYNTDKETPFIKGIYSECRNISIDYGIMEKADNVFVLTADIGWSDLGTWGSLYDQTKKDEHKNAVLGKNVFLYDVNNTLVRSPDKKLVVIQGLNDCIVVESDDVLLICKMDQEQRIKSFVNDIKLEKGEEFI